MIPPHTRSPDKNMRIGFLTPPTTIVERQWIEFLAGRGHEVHVLYFEGDGGAGLKPEEDFPDLAFRDGIRLHPLPQPFPFRFLLKLSRSMYSRSARRGSRQPDDSPNSRRLSCTESRSTAVRIASLLKEMAASLLMRRKASILRRTLGAIKPDVLHALYITHNGFLGALSGFHPLVITAYGSDVLVDPYESRQNRLSVEFALRHADVVTTQSIYVRRHVQAEFQLPEDKIRTILWGINLETFNRSYEAAARQLKMDIGIDHSWFVLLSPRVMTEHYRIRSIVQAMPHILAKHPHVVLILLKGLEPGFNAAHDRYEETISLLSDDLGIRTNIRMIRRQLSPHEMAILYNASDAFVSIPRSDGAFAATIAEGMACGAVPILGQLEVYHQYVVDGFNGFFIDGENPVDIAEKVKMCVEHPELKETFFGINASIIREKEDWSKNAPKMEELYAELLRRQ